MSYITTFEVFKYLEKKLKIKDQADLKKRLLEKCDSLDMKALAADVKPFLFSPTDAKRVLLFRDYIDSRLSGSAASS